MNQQTVVIKSNKYGITLFLDKDTEFSELLKDIGEKFKASSKFFKDAQMAIAFEGRILSQEEQILYHAVKVNADIQYLALLGESACHGAVTAAAPDCFQRLLRDFPGIQLVKL